MCIVKKQMDGSSINSALATAANPCTSPDFVGRSSWIRTVPLVLASMMGTGVYDLPATFADLGVVSGAACFISISSISYFVSYLLYKLHMAFRYPAAANLGELLSYHFGLVGGWVGYGLLYVSCLQWEVNYADGLVTTVRHMLHPPLPNSTPADARGNNLVPVLCSGVVLLPLVQIRRLHRLTWLSVMSVVSIFAVMAADVLDVCEGGRLDAHCRRTQELTPKVLTLAISQIAFAFNGQILFLQIQSEMQTPAKFLHSLQLAYPVLLVCYIIFALLGWTICRSGAAHSVLYDHHIDEFMSVSPVLYFCVCISLLVHLATSYTIIQQVLVRELAIWLCEGALEQGPRARLRWFAISTGQLTISLVAAQWIPGLRDVPGMVGIMVNAMTFIFPCVLYLATRTWSRDETPSRREFQLLPWPHLDIVAVLASYAVIVVAMCVSVPGFLFQVGAMH